MAKTACSSGSYCCSKRFTFAIMGFLSMAMTYMLRVDINVALVGMVNHTALAMITEANIMAPEMTLKDAYARRRVNSSHAWTMSARGTSQCKPFQFGGSAGGAGKDVVPSFMSPPGVTSYPLWPYPTPIPYKSDSSQQAEGPFVWEEAAQTIIMSSYFAGYGLTQSFGGRVAEHFGGKHVVSYGLISAGILHFLVPVAATANFYVLVVQRVLTGAALGFTSPSINVMLSKWCPPTERSRMNNIVQSGAQLGKVVAMPVTGLILASFGWQLVFYIFGLSAIFLYILWTFVVRESPAQHPSISPDEQKKIEESIGHERFSSKLPVPWKDLLRSKPFWAIFIGVFGNAWGSSIVTTLLPTYLNNMLKFSVAQNGFISAIPHLTQLIFGFPISYLVDYLRRKNVSSVTTLRKISHAIGQIGAGLSLLMVTYVDCDQWAMIGILAVYGAVQGFNHSAFSASMLDIAPNFAGTITSVGNIGYNVVSLVGPIVGGMLLSGQQTWERWSLIFQISAACYGATALIFILMASGEEQPWNRPQPTVSLADEATRLLPDSSWERKHPQQGFIYPSFQHNQVEAGRSGSFGGGSGKFSSGSYRRNEGEVYPSAPPPYDEVNEPVKASTDRRD